LGDGVGCLILILLAELTVIRLESSEIGKTHVFDHLIKMTKNLLQDDIRVRRRVGSRHHVERLQDGSVEEGKREEDAG
jgi:hypothetical protein